MYNPFDLTTFQGLIFTLENYWAKQGCAILQPIDMEVGAATFHPASFFGALGPTPSQVAFVQPCRRPTDGRYGENPNRFQRYYQYQVLLKPNPLDIQDLYLNSLKMIGIDPKIHDIRFVEDNWESPALGAWGLGWEIWLNGMEISQFSYFQQMGGLECKPVSGEITYGLERIAMALQNIDDSYQLIWAHTPSKDITYGDLSLQEEKEQCAYNFEQANIPFLQSQFDQYEKDCQNLIKKNLPFPAYEMVLKNSHLFNLLDARHAISTSERQRYLLRIRTLATLVAEHYYAQHSSDNSSVNMV